MEQFLRDFGVPIIVSVISAVLVAWLTSRRKVDRVEAEVEKNRTDIATFRAMDATREAAWTEWRRELSERMNNHAGRLHEMADHSSRIARLEKKVNGN